MFEERLKKLCNTTSGPYLRPFSPNANWRKAPLFIVGENPATPLRDEFSSFDEYWQGLTRDPDIFLEKYAFNHRGGTSKTTGWVSQLTRLVGPGECLVTNVCWYPSKPGLSVPKHDRSLGPEYLGQLIEYCEPKVLFFHGNEACKFAENFFGTKVDRYAPPQEQQVVAGKSLVFAYHHFSGQGLRSGAKFKPAEDIPVFAERIRRHIENGTA